MPTNDTRLMAVILQSKAASQRHISTLFRSKASLVEGSSKAVPNQRLLDQSDLILLVSVRVCPLTFDQSARRVQDASCRWPEEASELQISRGVFLRQVRADIYAFRAYLRTRMPMRRQILRFRLQLQRLMATNLKNAHIAAETMT